MAEATAGVRLEANPRVGVTAAAIAPVGAAAAAATAVALHVVAAPGGPHLRFADIVTGISFPLAGAMVLRRDPRNAAGRLLVATAVLAFGPLLNELAWRSLRAHPRDAAGEAALWVANWIWTPYLLLPTLVVLLLPGGRLPSRRWRPVAAGVVAGTAVAAVAAMFRPGASDQIASLDNPLGIGGASFLTPLMAAAVALVLGVGGALCVSGLLVRQRRAAGEERARLQWLGAGAAAAATAFAGSIAAPWPLGEVLLGAGLVALPVSIAVATWRHRLYEAEVVLNRAAASFLLTVAGLVVYAAVVGASERTAPAAAALLALGAAAAWRRVQRFTRHLLYGARDEPLAVLQRVGSQIDSVDAPAQAIQVLVETVRDALRLPYVAVTNGEIGAAAGRPVAGVEAFDCSANGRDVAVLEVGHRHRGEQWSGGERALLVDSARRAAALVEAGRLVADLERSRSSIVAAREEERRRLRRELHDGIASALAGISLQLDCLDDRDGARRPEALTQIQESMRALTSEMRALVHDLRPPALDQVGLATAVAEQARAWLATLPVEVESDALPPLPAATEVAAYRIATEAIANAARHGDGRSCRVRFALEHAWLRVEIEDDGRGFAGEARRGVGLDAMRTRATELGGDLEIVSVPGSGTCVTARLPLEIR